MYSDTSSFFSVHIVKRTKHAWTLIWSRTLWIKLAKVRNGNLNSVLVSRVIWNIILIFNFSLKLSGKISLEEGEGLGEVACSRGGCGNLTEARGIEHYGLSGLSKSFFVCFFFLLLRYAGLIFLVLFAVVAFPLALSTQPTFKPVRRSQSYTVCKHFQ